jgi:transposase
MRNIHEFDGIYLHCQPVDGRKGINGLVLLIAAQMGRPTSGSLFVFTSRRRDVVKIVYWDRSGFAMWMKRLEKERFRWPLKMSESTVSLGTEQLSWLLDGYDITKMKPHATLNYDAIS